LRTRYNRYAWLVVALLALVWLLNYLDRQVVFSIFPLLERDLHVSPLQLGLVSTAFLWVYALCSPWAGHLADRFGKKRMICASLLVWSAVTLLSGRVHSFGQLLALRGVMGISEACYLPAGLAMIAAYHGERTRSRAVSLHYSGTYVGTILGGVLGGWIGAVYGWRSVFAIFGVIGLAYGLVLFVFLKDKAAPEGGAAQTSNIPLLQASRLIFSSAGFSRILAVFAIASICDWTIYTWMPLYLYETLHFSLTKAGFAATFYMKAGGFAGLLLGGFLADAWAQRSRRGRVLTQTLGLLSAAPCLVLCGIAHAPILLYGVMILFGLGKGVYDGNTMPVLCESVPAELRATAFGFLNFAGTLFGGIVAALAGALKSAVGLNGALIACGLLLFLAAALLSTIHTRSTAASLPPV